MKVVVYSANYGGYDLPKVQPDLGVPLVLFTDDPALIAPGWDCRHDPLASITTPMLRAKWWKCRPDLAVPEADLSLWIDGSMTVRSAGYVEQVLAQLGDAEALFTTHPWRDCIYDECEASVGAAKYSGQAMREQVRDYRFAGHPANWGLFATGAIARRHIPAVRHLGGRWFTECANRSVQDQLSLPVLVRQAAIHWRATDPVTTPWQTWWDIADHVG